MKKVGNYYYGFEYNGAKWMRLNVFPFGFSISFDEFYGMVFELSIFHIKIFFGSKIDSNF